jgi:glycosyltransferase involved in cell wall biosynthesis
MLNILFVYRFPPETQKGGIEKVINVMMAELKKNNFNCYFVICNSGRIRKTILTYSGKNITNLKDFLLEKRIDIILNHNYDSSFTRLFENLELNNIRYITFFHDAPGQLLHNLKHRLKSKRSNIIDLISLLLFPISLKFTIYKYQKDLCFNYNNSDKYVLLSEKFIPELLSQLKIKYSSKICAIPNPLSFDDYFPINQLNTKEKIAIVVSRLEESQKRITEIIQIWHLLNNKNDNHGWKLYILGDGQDRKLYEKMVKEKNLKNIVFTGRVDPLPYYQKASICLMTSSHEGWGLVLTEAMQNGIVPLAYNSYSSITDIITNNYNGYLIENNNKNAFVDNLHDIIKKDTKRIEMAKNAIKSSKRFEKKIVIKKWTNLLTANNK